MKGVLDEANLTANVEVMLKIAARFLRSARISSKPYRRIGRLQPLEASDQADHVPQLAVIGLDNVVETLHLPMLRVLRCPDCVKVLNVGYEPEDADLNIAYPRDRTSSAKLLALTRHLRSAFGSPLIGTSLRERAEQGSSSGSKVGTTHA